MIVHLLPGIGQDDSRVSAIVTKARQYELLPEVHQEQGAHHAPVMVYLKDSKQRARAVPDHVFATMEGVKEVVRVSPAQISLAMNGGNEPHHVQIGNSLIGKGLPCLPVIGSCTIDSLTPELIRQLASLGVRHVRGGWRKPRSSAQSYRGPGKEGLYQLFAAADQHGIESVWTEVVESADIDIVRRIKNQARYRGEVVLWVGARNIGNYLLLEALGQQDEFKVMLKNGIHMQTVDELFTAAEFVLAGPMYWDSETGILDERRSRAPGNQELILCVRGLHNRDPHSRLRYYPNYDWITTCHERAWAPVVFDPSHIAGKLENVFPVLEDGLRRLPDVVLIEAHLDPNKALCDKDQAVPIEQVPDVLSMIMAHNQRHYAVAPESLPIAVS